MRAVVLAVALLPATALAQKPKLSTRIAVAGELEGVQSAFDPVRSKLDGCWKKPAKARATVTFTDGTVSDVQVTGTNDPRAKACLAKVLRGAVLADASARVTATLDLTSEPVKEPPLTSDKKVIDSIVSREPVYLGKFTGIGKGPGGGGTGSNATKSDAPKVLVGSSEDTSNGRSADDIQRVMQTRAGEFRACYQRELHRTPDLEGKVIVQFEIGEDGSVKMARVTSSTLKSSRAEACLAAQVRRLTFPASASPSTVSYPFVFSKA